MHGVLPLSFTYVLVCFDQQTFYGMPKSLAEDPYKWIIEVDEVDEVDKRSEVDEVSDDIEVDEEIR